MPRQASQGGASVAARSLGLKTPAYLHLRDALAAGEFPVYLRTADPALAGMFPNPFGFELLLERLRQVDGVERRRANLLRALEGREDADEQRGMVQEARDEGDLEDVALGIEPSPAPEGAAAPEKEEHVAFLATLRADARVARALREAFAEHGTLSVEAVEGAQDGERFRGLVAAAAPLKDADPARYLQVRRGERAHALKLDFELPRVALQAVFDGAVRGFPVQEKDSYFALFQGFVRDERLPRLVQGARARLKRAAEEQALEQGWSMVEQALDRGRQDGPILGVCAGRGRKLVAALTTDVHTAPRTAVLDPGAADLAAKLQAFLGEDTPQLVAFQADGPTRNATQKLLKALGAGGRKLRQVPVPVAVTRTMLREVARRPSEALLGQEERQAFLVAVLALEPRAAAFHTPHIVRAFISFRGEVNHRILDDFEATFLRALLQERGVDVNEAGADLLRLVPGVEAEAVVVERSTAPFRSLEDFQARMCLPPAAWRAACCLLRVRGGDEPLDARGLHPDFYAPLRAAAERGGVEVGELIRDASRLGALPWNEVLEGVEHAEGVVSCIRRSLSRTTRRRPRPGRPAARPVEALQPGTTLKGTVTNLTDYGAFVNIGARREGLVHVSHCAAQFVKHPSEVLTAGQQVEVRVLSVDLESQKIRLSMLSEEQEKERAAARGGRGDGPGGGPGGEGGRRDGGRREGQGGPGGRGGRRPGGPGGSRGGRDGRDGRDSRPRRENFGPDPRAKREEFDPTNPFYQFFKNQQDDGKEGKKS